MNGRRNGIAICSAIANKRTVVSLGRIMKAFSKIQTKAFVLCMTVLMSVLALMGIHFMPHTASATSNASEIIYIDTDAVTHSDESIEAGDSYALKPGMDACLYWEQSCILSGCPRSG